MLKTVGITGTNKIFINPHTPPPKKREKENIGLPTYVSGERQQNKHEQIQRVKNLLLFSIPRQYAKFPVQPK